MTDIHTDPTKAAEVQIAQARMALARQGYAMGLVQSNPNPRVMVCAPMPQEVMPTFIPLTPMGLVRP